MDLWYSICKDIVKFYQVFFIKPWIKGKEHIPSGPKIIVGNHSLATDAFVLPSIFREKLHFLIQYDIFHVHFFGKLLELADQIPVVKGQGREALRAARQKLEMGHSVVVFPEGRLNNGQQLYHPHTGAALLATQTGVPVVPVGFYTPPKFIRIFHSQLDNRPTTGGWQFGGPLFINIGEPLLAKTDTCDYVDVKTFTVQVMNNISDLINEIKTGTSTQELAM